MYKIKIMIVLIAIIVSYLSINAFVPNPQVATAPSVPGLYSPSGTNVSLTSPLVVINSTGGTGARLYDFLLAYASDGNFSNPVVRVSDIPEGSNGKTSYTLPSPLAGNTQYIWKAECHASGEFSGFPTPIIFTTE